MAGNLNNVNIGDPDILEVINRYLKDVVEKEGYFTGWIDEEFNLNEFLREYEVVGSTSFKLRSSALRGSAKRYGNKGICILIVRKFAFLTFFFQSKYFFSLRDVTF